MITMILLCLLYRVSKTLLLLSCFQLITLTLANSPLLYGQQCDSTENICDSEASLVCLGGMCGCNRNTSVYNIPTGKCVLLVGMPCDTRNPCVPNSNCENNVCNCNQPNFFVDSKGQCERKRDIGENCENDYGCLPEFICGSSGTCSCPEITHYYDHSTTSCVARIRAGEACNSSSVCVEYSWCGEIVSKNLDTRSRQTCICDRDFFQNSTDFCELPRKFGKVCESNEYCETDLICGESATCECPAPWLVYDSKTETCVALEGTSCEVERPDWYKKHNCVDGAECVFRNGDKMIFECVPGLTKSLNKTCLRGYLQACTESWMMQCDKDKGLVCKQGRCEYKSDHWVGFDWNRRKYQNYVYGPCKNSTECVRNSHCSENSKCECDAGLVEVKGICFLSIGQPCSYENNQILPNIKDSVLYDPSKSSPDVAREKCDPLATLKCIEGTCQCEPWEIYDDEQQKCRGRAGSYCEVNQEDYCTQNAQCVKKRSPRRGEGICECKNGHPEDSDNFCTGAAKGFVRN